MPIKNVPIGKHAGTAKIVDLDRLQPWRLPSSPLLLWQNEGNRGSDLKKVRPRAYRPC